MKNIYKISLILIILAFLAKQGRSQLANPAALHIQSKKFSAISGEQAQTKVTPERLNYTVPYQRSFGGKPEVGLSVYNMQFDYNPQFSINIIQQSSTTANFVFYVSGRPSDSNIFNQLYIMYIASDYNQLGIYMPGPKNTTAQLGIPTNVANRSQQFTFNFKNIGTQPIFPASGGTNNIRVTVYLTGIDAQSQTIQNGYSKNYAYFALAVSKITTNFYSILVSVHSSYGDVQIRTIQFTVIYFDTTQISNLYQMNSNYAIASNFGGTFFMSSYSLPLDALTQNPLYQNTLQYFFGISSIQCSQGETINILAVQRFNYNANGKLQNLVLTFQTQRNTYIRNGVYNYIQYKPKTCTDSAACGIPCNDPNQPSYRITNLDNQCAPCLYFCTACQNGFNCTSCPSTRVLSASAICVCVNMSLYDDQNSKECQNCFDTNFCNTCTRKGVCETCYKDNNFTFNTILRTCQCSAGTYNAVGPTRNTNTSILITRKQTICQACPPRCLYCTAINNCQACEVPTYLALNSSQINGVVQTCSQICNNNQIYNTNNRSCTFYGGDTSLFDSAGRLGFDWTYTSQDNQMIINLLLSQRNMTYYFYENGKGYQYISTTYMQNQTNSAGTSQYFYDDGNGYIGGYSGVGPTSFASSVINTKKTTRAGGYNFDESALKGEYYGLGEAKFFSDQYKLYQPTASYFDQFNIPFGKHQLKTTTIADSATFLDAIRNNLQFVINNQSLPYTIRALSGNQFQLIVRPQKSYLTTNASVIFKNPALVRNQQTALQTPIITKQIDRLDYYTQSQLQNAISLRDRTITIVQILWGICKYLLFIGIGWPVMPLMLVLQYIFSHNYITSQLPLNLYYFLTSFADFRNPSILFNPQRNQFDAQVVNHPQIYKRIAIYQRFDRGIDFMKNCWEFFFVPLVSFGLLFALIGFNFLINKLCKRDIPIISKFLQKRGFLHAGAYTLVQALPISFFFFGQLHDTRYNSLKSPNSIYPSFNTGMAYASFFTSAILPLVLLVWIYNYFKDRARSGKFELQKVQGTNANQVQPVSNDPAMIGDPLWSGNPYTPTSYGFGAAVYYLPLLAGFVLSFFHRSYPWQLTGLLVGHAALGSFAAASNHFQSKIPRFFFTGLSALMVAYQLVHAGVGSNRALSTYDQWNTGYLGIGIIYALILAAIIFSGYLLYKFIKNIYDNIIKPYGCFPKLSQVQNTPLMKQTPDQQVNLRDKALGRDQRRRTTIQQSKLTYLPPNSYDRMLHSHREVGTLNQIGDQQMYHQKLLLQNTLNDGRATFRCSNSNQTFTFPRWSSNRLKENLPLIIDSQNKIYNAINKRLIGDVPRLLKDNSQTESEEELMMQNAKRHQNTYKQIQLQNMRNNRSSNDINDAYLMVKRNNSNLEKQKSLNFINVNGKQVNYQEDDDNFYLMNFNGTQKYQASDKEFFNLFSQNQNKIKYDNKQYFIERSEQPNNFYLVNPANYQRIQKVSLQNLKNMLNKRLVSTSLLPSHKTISSQNQYVQYNPNTNKSIVFTKDTQQYLINGKSYQKQREDAQNLYFINSLTGQRISVKKTGINIRAAQSMQQTGSMKELVESKLANFRNQIFYENQRYVYTGLQNNRYAFMNQNTGSMRLFTIQQLAKLLGFAPTQITLNNNNSVNKFESMSKKQISQKLIPQNVATVNYKERVELILIQKNTDQGVYVFQDPNNESQNIQIPVQMIDLSQPVELDKDGHIWHKGQQFDFSQSSEERTSQQNNQVLNSQGYNTFVPNKSVPSSQSSMGLSENIDINHFYNIKFLSPDFVHGSDNKLPSGKDILEVRENVRGSSVAKAIQQMRQINPFGKILIQSLSNPSQKFIIE